MAKLREGGLAIFVAGPSEIIGLVVITERFVSSGEMVILPSGRRFRNVGSPRWLIHNERIYVTMNDGSVINDYSLCFPHWLMPIDGDDFSNEGEHQKGREYA